jgi:hypothetical protein
VQVALRGELLVAGFPTVVVEHFVSSSAAVFAATEHLTSASVIVAIASEIGSAAFASTSVVGSSAVA